MTGHRAYYNDNDKTCAEWTRQLIRAGHIAPGDVDDRDVRDVTPGDLAGYTQCHFFCGIGLWSLALRWAGWDDARPIWTGSCPCQPFSTVGRREGFADWRHLWPVWFQLIRQCAPVALAGEQVSGPHGRAWLDAVQLDLETCDYACGALAVSSAGVGAPNIRQRLYWVAERIVDWMSDADRRGGDRLGDAGQPRLPDTQSPHVCRPGRRPEGRAAAEPSRPPDPWREPSWIRCKDGRARPVESRIQRLADGHPSGVGGVFPLATRQQGDAARLRGYGNAINPYVASEVIQAWMELT